MKLFLICEFIVLKNVLRVVAVAQLLVCCSAESSRIGRVFFQNGALDISSIDSSIVQLSTVTFDSLISNNTIRVLVGTHDDNKLARTTASVYFQPVLSDVSV